MLLSVCKKFYLSISQLFRGSNADLCGPKIEITMFEQNMDFWCIHTAINTGWELVRCLTDRLNKYLASLLQQCYLNIFSTFATHGLLHSTVCLFAWVIPQWFISRAVPPLHLIEVFPQNWQKILHKQQETKGLITEVWHGRLNHQILLEMTYDRADLSNNWYIPT